MKTPGFIFRAATLSGIAALLFLAGCASHAPAPVVERGVPSKPAAASKDFYTVKKGDTLYSIALDNGQDYKDVAAWNNLENPNRILVGQQLRVTPPDGGAAGTAVAKPIGGGVVESRSLDGGPAPAAASDTLKREPKAGKEAYSDQAWAKAQNQNQNNAQGAAAKPAEPVRSEAPAAAAAPAAADVTWAWPAGGKSIAGFNEATNKGVDIAGKLGEPVLAAADGKVVYSGSGLRGYGKLVIIKHDATFLSAYAHNNNILVKEGQSVTRGQKIAEMGNSDTDQVKLHFEIRRQGKPVDPTQYLPKR
ncbi:lipoprotein NlpD [Azospira oryzae]|uniref:Lipoprotein NlpD n=1 Tax=Azospira oryzae TaxID=146939 RepID=A0ABY0IP90_9RHOO|nr:peptidoglycan DD-metalloendopeptidase family protein [Azospira oryzae]RZT89383.1 lipoprotein NlpD [Azospira oryzae]